MSHFPSVGSRRARRGVTSTENHTITGGLGSATGELMARRGVLIPLCMRGIQNQFQKGFSYPALFASCIRE